MSHDALRELCKIYIAAYKSGAKAATVAEDQIIYWHRPSPKAAVASADPLGPPKVSVTRVFFSEKIHHINA